MHDLISRLLDSVGPPLIAILVSLVDSNRMSVFTFLSFLIVWQVLCQLEFSLEWLTKNSKIKIKIGGARNGK